MKGGISHESTLKVGTAGTAIRLDDCNPGAFDSQSHLARVIQNKRTTMTVETLRADIDWTHVQCHSITALGLRSC
jgi:predicted transcriptional regulator